MRKSVLNAVLLFAVSMFVGAAHAQESSSTANDRYTLSEPFATANEAAMFANMHPFGPRWGGTFSEFLCEFVDGAPMSSGYRVIYARYEGANMGESPQWKAKEGFATLEEAKDFVNANRFGMVQFVSCWNPYRTPASTTITVFYLHAFYGELFVTTGGEAYRIWGGPFASPREAAEYAGEHLSRDAYLTAQFVPQLFAAKQTESLWYVIAFNDPRASNGNTRDEIWRVEEFDENKFPFSMESALAFRNEHVENELQSAVSTFSAAFLRSRVVILRLVQAGSGEKTDEAAAEDAPTFRANARAALIGIPTILYVDAEIGRDTKEIVGDAETAFEQIYQQTNIAFWNERVEAYDARGANPKSVAYATPRVPRSLNLFFSATPPSSYGHERSFELGLNGEKFIVIWVRPGATRQELVASLIHALAHKFTAQDVSDPSSAMFFDGARTGLSWTIDKKNLVLIRQMALLARRWGSVDIAFALNN